MVECFRELECGALAEKGLALGRLQGDVVEPRILRVGGSLAEDDFVRVDVSIEPAVVLLLELGMVENDVAVKAALCERGAQCVDERGEFDIGGLTDLEAALGVVEFRSGGACFVELAQHILVAGVADAAAGAFDVVRVLAKA